MTVLENLLRPKEAAALLAISARTLWSLTASGEIASLRIGRAIRYRPEDLRAFIDRNWKDRKPRC